MQFFIPSPNSDEFKNPEIVKSISEQAYFINKNVTQILWNSIEKGFDISFSEAVDQRSFLTAFTGLAEKTIASFKHVKETIFWQNKGSAKANLEDPHTWLLEKGFLKPTSAGQFVYSGYLQQIISFLDDKVKYIGAALDAIEEAYPTTISLLNLKKSGYLSSFPQHAFFVSHVIPEMGELEKSILEFKKSDNDIHIQDHLEEPSQVLSPTVCYHCFEALKDKVIDQNMIFTASANCHRHEYKTAHGLERLQTFKMRELMFFGTDKFVTDTRDQIIERVKIFLEELDLECRIVSANDPFFASDAAKKRSYQSFLGLKQEIQAYLPYKQKWLSVGSFNLHKDSLTKPFHITSSGGAPISSGCMGIGLERLALAMLAQNGLTQALTAIVREII